MPKRAHEKESLSNVTFMEKFIEQYLSRYLLSWKGKALTLIVYVSLIIFSVHGSLQLSVRTSWWDFMSEDFENYDF